MSMSGHDHSAAGNWPGWDTRWMHDVVEPLIADGTASRLIDSLARELTFSPGRPLLVGVPLKLADSAGGYLRRVAEAYHRLITQVIALHREDRQIQEVVASPQVFAKDLRRSEETEQPDIHLMRIDSLPQTDGSIRIIETNANCPGLLVFTGIASRAWRDRMTDQVRLALPLSSLEQADWLVRWIAESAGNRTLSPVCLLRRPGGNRLELDEYGMVLRRNGIDVFEASPAEVTLAGGAAWVAGCRTEVGYLKLGMQDFMEIRSELDEFVEAVRCGALFVPNGQRSRWVGDSKLCLAVLSNPQFSDCFDKADYEAVRDTIPWSRNLAMCRSDVLQRIADNRRKYVIKRPLDTRGRGVFLGVDMPSRQEWDALIAAGVRQSWLVQEFVPGPVLPDRWTVSADAKMTHDLAIAVANGAMAGVLARSSRESRVNMALTGRFHPVPFRPVGREPGRAETESAHPLHAH